MYEYAAERTMIWGQPATGRSSSRWDTPTPPPVQQLLDYTIINVILLPLFTIVDGRRRGINRPWLFFVSSLFTSCVFAWAFYLATVERQRRHQQAGAPLQSAV